MKHLRHALKHARHALIWLADQFDHYLLDHRWHRLCHRIGTSDWWGDGKQLRERGEETR